MSGTVDDEVVRMRFDNSAFERGVAATLGTLAKLKNSLNFSGADKGLDGIQAKASKFDMSAMNKQIDDSSRHWSAWRSAGLIAFATLVHQGVLAGEHLLASFTIDPIKDGFQSYETQINAAKIIISNTGAKLPAVEAQLNQLQTYANQTVYSFSDMAKNIGTFTAAGVKLVPATSAIKGMGNSAALSGANVEQLNSAMYQMSQAMSSGVIRLQDWNSLSNANMGGQNIQKALMSTAETIKGTGPKMDAAIKKYGNFRQSLTAGWLTADVFSKAMGVMAGTVDKATGKTRAFTVAELKAKGYTTAHAEELHRLSQAAIESATQIRTYTQLTQALKEEVGTAWGAIFKTLFGNVNGATKLFTGLHNVLEAAFTNPIYALNRFLQKIQGLGGIAIFMDAIKLAFHTLAAVMHTVQAAFREIFPPASAQQIVDMIKAFHVFIENLMPMPATMMKLQHIFAAFFAVLDIGRQIFMGAVHMLESLFGAVAHGSGGFLNFASHISVLIVAFDQALKKGDLFKNFFAIIGNILSIPLHLLGLVGSAIGSLFSRFNRKDANNMASSVTAAGNALGRVANITKRVSDWFAGLSGKIQPAIHAIVNAFMHIGSAIAKGLGSAQFGNILKTLEVGLLGGILVAFKKFLSSGLHLDIGGGFLKSGKEALEGVTGSLRAMQTQLKAKALMEIAIALGILVASIVAMSFIDPKTIETSMKALAVGFGELLGALAVLGKISGSAIKLPVLAASLNLIATAILILTTAVIAMSFLSWQQLEKGLGAVAGLLIGISVAAAILSKSGGLISAGIGITAIAVAMNLLYLAVLGFGHMSWSEMLKGLAGIGIALAGIAIAMRLMPKGMLAQSASILLVSVALNALYLAVREFSSLSWTEMIKGLTGVAGGLTAIAIGMRLMPPGMIAQSIALGIIGVALQGIARAVGTMGGMSWSEIGKGLTTLAGSLAILAGALYIMQGSLGGAAALLVVAGALHLFIPSLQALASMSWGDILKGLGALALSFAAIGLAGLLLTPVIPAILALGVALGLVGLAMVAFGGGMALLGIGLTAIAASGGAAIAVLLGALKSAIQLLPTIATSIATALVSFLTIIGKNAPTIVGAFVKLLRSLLDAVPQLMPSLIKAIGSLVTAILTVLTNNAPKIIAAGLALLMDLLKGITSNIGQIVTSVANIIVNFLNALANNMGRIVNAGFNLLVKFLIGIAGALGRVPGVVLQVVWAFLGALTSNLGKIAAKGLEMLGRLVAGILGGIGRLAAAGLALIGKFISGILGGMGGILKAGIQAAGKFISGVASQAGHLVASGLSLVGHAVAGVGSKIKDFFSMGSMSVQGIINGMLARQHDLRVASATIASTATASARNKLGIQSPSKVFYEVGNYMMEGWRNGIAENAHLVHKAMGVTGDKLLGGVQGTISAISASFNDMNNMNPTISPVLDLTQLQKDAPQIADLLSNNSAYVQAANISASTLAKQAAQANAPAANTPPTITFEQKNYSPTALSTIDIYRQTNNQLSQAKKALGVVTATAPA